MIIEEFITVVSIVSIFLSFTLLGAFLAMVYRLHVADTIIRESAQKMDNKTIEFDKITRDSSLANNSMAKMLQDQGDVIAQLDERISMLSGSGGGGASWQPKR